MATRIDLELTSDRGDGTWTWRAPRAKNPKGIVDASLLPSGAKVGDVLRGDAEFAVDGIDIISVSAPKERARAGIERLEVLGSGRKEELVTTQLVKKGKGRGRGRGRDRDFGGGRGGGFDRGGRDGGGRGEGRGRSDRPAPRRLRPQRVHRNAWLETIPVEQRPIAEQMLEGGLPSVREALEAQNAAAAGAGKPPAPVAGVMALAERLAPDMKTAEWRDKAEAAMAEADVLDLRDLRPVVTASATHARTDETRDLAERLRKKVSSRIDRDHETWLAELRKAITEGRIIRALRQSARPVKVGSPIPEDVAKSLVEAANKAFEPDAEPDRWTAVLDAVAFSPVRQFVVPEELPEEASDKEIQRAVRKLSNRVPQIAALFGIEPRTNSRGGKSEAKGSGKSGGKGAAKKGAGKPDASGGAPKAEKDAVASEAADVELQEGEKIITVQPEIDEPPAKASSEEE